MKKEKLLKIKGFKTLKIPKMLNYKVENMKVFIKELEQILNYSQTQNKLMVFLSETFWKETTKIIEKPSVDNIVYLSDLRKNFKKYFELVKNLYGKEKKDHLFYKNAEETNEKDEIAIILNLIIQKNIEEDKEITNDQIINQITQYDIYYIENIYENRRELYFLDKINLNDKENVWMDSFKNCHFEDIFNNDIENYILKLVCKIKILEDLEIVLNIINEDKIINSGKIEYFIELLRKKTLNLMKNYDIPKEEGEGNGKLSALIKLLKFIYTYTENFDKILDIFNKLEKESKHIVYKELLKSFYDKQKLRDHIFDFYVNHIDLYYKNISDLFEILKEEKTKLFMSKFTDEKEQKKNNKIISYEDFFVNGENLKLTLLKELSKKIELIKNTPYIGKSKEVLRKIYIDIEKKKLEICKLKSLLSNNKENVIGRLELFQILPTSLNPEGKYEELKKKYQKAENEIKELRKISETLKVFHKDFHIKEIKKIDEKIDKFNTGEILEFEKITKLILELGNEIKKKVEKINKIKESSVFRKLFESTQGKNQNERYEKALKELPKELNKLKKVRFDEKIKKEFQMIADVLGLKEDEKTLNDLKYMEKSSGAEDDIKSMIDFCRNFKININDFEEENTDFENLLKETYENIKSNKEEKKENLKKLEEMGIYNYESKGLNVEFFNLFNGQKEAIDFLLTKSHENLEIIKDKLISIDNAVKSNDIDEVDNCLDFFNNILKNCKNKSELFQQINKINPNLLENFKKYIQIFQYLVELDNNSDNSYNLYISAKKYFSDSTYYISLDFEEYSYIDAENKKEKTIDLYVIKSIKHKINFPNEIGIRLKENKELLEGQERNSLDKTLFLLKFKEVVNNIELIEQFISVFQVKGCSLPLEIKISIEYPEVSYFLKKKKISFSELSQKLLNMKNYLEKTLDLNYKKQQNLRFLYGQQFETLNKHISGSYEIPSFLRYILNNLNDSIKIKEGIKSSPRSTENYVEEYKAYSDDSFKIYDNYISSIMKENETNIEEIYERMKIKSNKNDDGQIYKGIYLYKSNSNSMEEDILKIFIEKTKNIPIAQNILISNKETSYEEIQAFFHRAFLCRFNTLFTIEINDSLSDLQQKIMNNFINQLLKFQRDKYKKTHQEEIDIKETNKFIEPLIIFVYDIKKPNQSILNEINKFNPGEYPRIAENISLNDSKSSILSSKKSSDEQVEYKLNRILLDNTHIYSSEIY